MISRLCLQNYKRHANTEITLAPLTVLVGPNGSGKTSVLEALHLLSGLDKADLVGEPQRPSPSLKVRRVAGVSTMRLGAYGASQSETRTLVMDLVRMPHNGWEGSTTSHGGVQQLPDGAGTLTVVRSDLPFVGPLGYWPELHLAVFLRLNVTRVALATRVAAITQIGEDGAGLATVIANRKLADESSIRSMQDALKDLVPEFEALRIFPTTVNTAGGTSHSGYRMEFDMQSGKGIAAEDISQGTLLLLALLSVVHSPERPRLLLLDDVEAGLHPEAQMKLAKLLRALTEHDDSLQIVMATHSPFMVDAVEPEAVVVFAKKPDGTVATRLLSEHPEHERLKGTLTSGQLWTLDSESDWVLRSDS